MSFPSSQQRRTDATVDGAMQSKPDKKGELMIGEDHCTVLNKVLIYTAHLCREGNGKNRKTKEHEKEEQFR